MISPRLLYRALIALGRHRDSRQAMYEKVRIGKPCSANLRCHFGQRFVRSLGIGFEGR